MWVSVGTGKNEAILAGYGEKFKIVNKINGIKHEKLVLGNGKGSAVGELAIACLC